MKTTSKVALAGLGLYLVSTMLKAASKAAPAFAPRGMEGYTPLMVGYDPAAEAIGCVNGSFEDQGLAGFGSKLKKSVKKVTGKAKSIAKKPVNLAKKATKQVQRNVKNVAKPLVRDFRTGGKLVLADFRKAGSLVKTDFTRADAMAKGLFGKNKKGKPSKQMQSTGGTIYLDENGNQITEAEYNRLMALYQSEYGMSPNYVPDGADQFNDDSPTFSMDQVAADYFSNQQNDPITDGKPEVDVLAYAQPFADETGFADGTVPYTGQQLWEMPTGLEYDPLAALYLPEDIQENTLDIFGAAQTSGDTLIMPAGEPSTPYTANELWIGYDDEDAASRGASWTPEPSGHGYGNPYQGGVQLPGYWQDYGGFDWSWENEGLGDLVLKPGAHKNASPAVLSMLKSQQKPNTYGYFMRQPAQRPIVFKADKKGMVYAQNGGRMHRIGPLTKLARALGLGCADFGRDMGVSGLGGWSDWRKKVSKVAEDTAKWSNMYGWGAMAYKKVDPKHYKEGRKAAQFAKPYALIAGGTALSVVSVGAASPAGVAMIGSGVASLATQAHKDYVERGMEKDLERQIERDREAEAIESTDVINQTQYLQPQGGPAAGEIPGGDWPWQYPGDGVWADFLDLTNSFAG